MQIYEYAAGSVHKDALEAAIFAYNNARAPAADQPSSCARPQNDKLSDSQAVADQPMTRQVNSHPLEKRLLAEVADKPKLKETQEPSLRDAASKGTDQPVQAAETLRALGLSVPKKCTPEILAALGLGQPKREEGKQCGKCGGLQDRPAFHAALCHCLGEVTVCSAATSGDDDSPIDHRRKATEEKP